MLYGTPSLGDHKFQFLFSYMPTALARSILNSQYKYFVFSDEIGSNYHAFSSG